MSQGRPAKEFALLKGRVTRLLIEDIPTVFGAKRDTGAGEMAALSIRGRIPSAPPPVTLGRLRHESMLPWLTGGLLDWVLYELEATLIKSLTC